MCVSVHLSALSYVTCNIISYHIISILIIHIDRIAVSHSYRNLHSHSHYPSHSLSHLPEGTVRMNSAGELPGFDNVTVSDTEQSTYQMKRIIM